MSSPATTALPLAGVRVIEFCSVAAGPFCGMLLADMGADVLKIEPPAGDALRSWPPINDGFSENFASINRNKRSAVLDLKLAEHAELARLLCAEADIVIENNRPGVMDRLGLGYERCPRSTRSSSTARSRRSARPARAPARAASI